MDLESVAATLPFTEVQWTFFYMLQLSYLARDILEGICWSSFSLIGYRSMLQVNVALPVALKAFPCCPPQSRTCHCWAWFDPMETHVGRFTRGDSSQVQQKLNGDVGPCRWWWFFCGSRWAQRCKVQARGPTFTAILSDGEMLSHGAQMQCSSMLSQKSSWVFSRFRSQSLHLMRSGLMDQLLLGALHMLVAIALPFKISLRMSSKCRPQVWSLLQSWQTNQSSHAGAPSAGGDSNPTGWICGCMGSWRIWWRQLCCWRSNRGTVTNPSWKKNEKWLVCVWGSN